MFLGQPLPRAGQLGICLALLLGAEPSLEAQGAPGKWQVSVLPLLTIGSRDAEGPELFGSIVGATHLSSGAVVVADGKSLELRFFSPDGKHLRTAGRSGGGPGEFRGISIFQRCAGDSVFVYDVAQARVSVFGPDGVYARLGNVRKWWSNGMSPYAFWCNPAGVMAFVNRSLSAMTPPEREGPVRIDVDLVLVHRDSVVILGAFPGSDMYFKSSSRGPRPLGKQTMIGVGATSVFVGTGDRFEIQEFSLEGKHLQTIREDRATVPVTTAEVEAYVSDFIARASGRVNTSTYRQYFQEIEWPKTYPAYGQLKVDGAGNLWVEEYPIPGKDIRDWTIYSRSGGRIAVITLPRGFRLLEAGRDYVLGVWRDELDVDYIRVYGLVKERLDGSESQHVP